MTEAEVLLNRINKSATLYEHTAKQWRVLHEKTKAAQQHTQTVKEAQAFLQQVALDTQRALEARLTELVNAALGSVFEDPYECDIHINLKRGKTEAEITLRRGGMSIDPLTAGGGGVADIVSLALRASCITLANPPVRAAIIADEPLRGLSKGYRKFSADFLQALVERLQMQIILVTHDEDFVCGNVVQI